MPSVVCQHLLLRRSVPVNALLDAAVDGAGGLLERQLGVDALDSPLDGRREELRAALDGGDEVVDVALPVRGGKNERVSG